MNLASRVKLLKNYSIRSAFSTELSRRGVSSARLAGTTRTNSMRLIWGLAYCNYTCSWTSTMTCNLKPWRTWRENVIMAVELPMDGTDERSLLFYKISTTSKTFINFLPNFEKSILLKCRIFPVLFMQYLCFEWIEHSVFRKILGHEPYQFDPTSDIYYCPNAKEYDVFLEHIRQIPLLTEPSVFGMNENADIIKDQKEMQMLCDSLLLTQVNIDQTNCLNTFLFFISQNETRIPNSFSPSVELKKSIFFFHALRIEW